MIHRFAPHARSCGLLLLAVVIGCGTKVAETVQQTASDVTKSVTETVSEKVDSAKTGVQEQLQMVGSSELTLDPAAPVKTPSCYATFTPATDGRPSVLSLRSYRAADKEVFPSFYLQAIASQDTVGELAGQTLPAVMFVKTAEDAATWYTAGDQLVQLKIVSVAEGEVTAEVVGGSLLRTDGAGTMNAAGKFTAVLQ